MKQSLILLGLIWSIVAKSQFCLSDNRFTEAEYFNITQIDSSINVLYGTAPNVQGEMVDLYMDVYSPNIEQDELENRPVVVLVHGGGFIVGNKALMREKCIAFAQRGFVAATINYRLNFPPNNAARYQATQDLHAAIRYIVSNTAEFGVNTEWIFVGGRSSGSITALNLVLLEQEDWNAIDEDFEVDFGGIEESGNLLDITFDVKGIFNNWGQTFLQGANPETMRPIISFHGEEDPLVSIDEVATPAGDTLIGSRYIHNMWVENDVCSELNIDPNGGHGIYDNPAGAIFRVEKASCFFKSIFCNECASLSTNDSIPASCSEPLSVQHGKHNNEYVVFPNPFDNHLTILGLKGTEDLILLNSQGGKIYSGKNLSEIDLSLLPSGLYFLKIKQGKDTSVIKLIKD
jgi:predicted esterase